jgi:flavin-dependent dehydrogenase
MSSMQKWDLGELPILADVDLVIAGATWGGIALGVEAARRGMRVMVVEPRTYPGYETSALLRPWIAVSELEQPPLLVGDWLEKAGRVVAEGREIALHPDLVKRALEDQLFQAGAELLYATHPVGVVRDSNGVAGIVVGHKGGLALVLSPAVVDATDWATLARVMGLARLRSALPRAVRMVRTIELTGVKGSLGSDLALTPGLGVHGDRAALHQGYLEGHVLLELAFELPLDSADSRGRMRLEVEARRRSLSIVEHLITQRKEFRRAHFAHGSWELRLDSPWSLSQPEDGDHPVCGEYSLGAFRSQTSINLVVLGTAAAIEDPVARARLLDPIAAARTGEALLEFVSRSAQSSRRSRRAELEIIVSARDEDPLKGGGSDALAFSMLPPRSTETARSSAVTIDELCDTDVLVAGGGTSGATAAAVSADCKVRTVLVEMNSGLGGTGTVGGIDSYWFGRRVGFTAEVDRRYAAVAERIGASKTGVWNVEGKMHALLEWALETGVEVFFRSVGVGVIKRGDAVVGAVFASPDGLCLVRAKVTIDATGDGDLAAHAGARFVYGSERDGLVMWYSLAPLVKPGRPRNNFTSTVDVTDVKDYTRAILAGRRRWDGHDHVSYLAPRESRHILGGVVLTVTDQLLLRKFDDVINICFSNCDIKGRSASDWVCWGLIPPNCEAEIPYRALVPEAVDGILVAGKAYSCTHDYLALARMQADLQNQGGACALAAAQAVVRGVSPREVNVLAVQRQLVERGVLPHAILGRSGAPARLSALALSSLIETLTGDEPFYLDQGFQDRVTEPSVLVKLCTAGGEVVPLLERAHEASHGKRKLLLARLLSWHGSRAGVSTLVAEILALLASGELPKVTTDVPYMGIAPDHGVMPEVCYLVYTLGMTRDPRTVSALERIVELFDPSEEEFAEKGNGAFHYADSVAYVAERLGSADVAPLLEALHAKKAVRGLVAQGPESDFIRERRAYLELVIGRALARCGAKAGLDILVEYLGDARSLFREHARAELRAVTERDYAYDLDAWRQWIAAEASKLSVKPWTLRMD